VVVVIKATLFGVRTVLFWVSPRLNPEMKGWSWHYKTTYSFQSRKENLHRARSGKCKYPSSVGMFRYTSFPAVNGAGFSKPFIAGLTASLALAKSIAVSCQTSLSYCSVVQWQNRVCCVCSVNIK
jgi:hypothetical protein